MTKYTIMFIALTIMILVLIRNIPLSLLAVIINYWLSIIAENTEKTKLNNTTATFTYGPGNARTTE